MNKRRMLLAAIAAAVVLAAGLKAYLWLGETSHPLNIT